MSETTFFDGTYYGEDVAAARISNLLSHSNIEISEEMTKEMARTIMGAMVGYLLTTDSYGPFVNCRSEKWGIGG